MLVEKPVITDQLFKSTNLCSQRSRFKEVNSPWAAVGTRQVRLAVTEGTTRKVGMDPSQCAVCLSHILLQQGHPHSNAPMGFGLFLYF